MRRSSKLESETEVIAIIEDEHMATTAGPEGRLAVTTQVGGLAYATGRRIEAYDMPTVRKIVRDAGTQDHRMSSYILGIVRSPAFQMQRADPGPKANTVAQPDSPRR